MIEIPADVKVHITHLRMYPEGLYTRHEANILGIEGPPSPKGGETVVWLETKDGVRAANGVSRCSDRDNFDRQKGRTIALGRAVKRAKERGMIA